jgi:signal transduction histidine kinase
MATLQAVGFLENEPSVTRRTKSGVIVTRLAIVGFLLIAGAFAKLGSPISGLAIAMIALALTVVTVAVPDHVPLRTVGNAITAVQWLVTFVVAIRTGGFDSPAVIWCAFHPLMAYLVAGRRWAIFWAIASAGQVAVVVKAQSFGLPITQDFSQNTISALKAWTLALSLLALALVIFGAEGHRSEAQKTIDQANQALERQRILSDMHDGIGSQLLGLMIQVRAKSIDDDRLLQGLSGCLEDLKLIVDSLDPNPRSFGLALAEIRSRMEPRCEAAEVELNWQIQADPPQFGPERTIQIIRALQEMMTNALRHSASKRIDVTFDASPSNPALYEVVVRDHGIGFDPNNVERLGRGLVSLKTRAQRLNGECAIEPANPGTAVTLRFPF